MAINVAASLEGTQPLKVGQSASVRFEVSAPGQDTAQGSQEKVELLAVFGGPGVNALPAQLPFVLPRKDLQPQVIEFTIEPDRAGELTLYLSIFLHRELTLLLEHKLLLDVVAG